MLKLDIMDIYDQDLMGNISVYKITNIKYFKYQKIQQNYIY